MSQPTSYTRGRSSIRQSPHHLHPPLPQLFIINIVDVMTIAFGTYQLEERANWTLNLMLVAVGYKYMIGDSLPNLAYLTKIDEFVLISFAVLALSTIRHGVALILPTYLI